MFCEDICMSKPKDEPVDGAKVAAEILKRMPSKDQKRLVQAIKDEAPQIAVKIEERLYNFDDLTELSPKSVQTLIAQVSHSDLVLSLKTASEGVKNVLFANMSDRKRRQVEDDFAALAPARISDVEAAQRRILDKMEELKKTGVVISTGKKDVWA